MGTRDYYSVRIGKIKPNDLVNLEVLKELFTAVYRKLEKSGYFQEYFGYYCVDGGVVQEDGHNVTGLLGDEIESFIFVALKKRDMYPILHKIEAYSEDDLFDVIEFLFDHISAGSTGFYHDFSNCGMHFRTFDREQGQNDFRANVNSILKDYRDGFELSDQGEVLRLPEKEFAPLMAAKIPAADDANIKARVELAKTKFRRRGSTIENRKEAIRELADVLEFLRTEAKEFLLTNDENDLFNLANNFGVRHHNRNQKVNYDRSIWYSWMFYYYLATIHALLRIIARSKNE